MTENDTDTTDDYDKKEAQYQLRNEPLKQAIDALAQYEQTEIDQHGTKARIAREHDVETHRIHYVLTHHPELVRWRRSQMRNPVDPAAVKASYEDETMQQLATSDGGMPVVQIEMSLDDAFRAMKRLPGDMGLDIYRQLLVADFDRVELRHALEGDDV